MDPTAAKLCEQIDQHPAMVWTGELHRSRWETARQALENAKVSYAAINVGNQMAWIIAAEHFGLISWGDVKILPAPVAGHAVRETLSREGMTILAVGGAWKPAPTPA
jgi:hypothetical protein